MTDSTDSNELSISVAKAIEKTMAKSFELSSSEVIGSFNKLEECLLKKGSETVESLEIKRRIAEAKISILFKKTDSRSEFESSWNDIESLGYSTKEREATMLFYRTQFLIRNKFDKALVSSTINRLGKITNSFKDEHSEQLAEHYNKVHKNLQIEMDSKYS